MAIIGKGDIGAACAKIVKNGSAWKWLEWKEIQRIALISSEANSTKLLETTKMKRLSRKQTMLSEFFQKWLTPATSSTWSLPSPRWRRPPCSWTSDLAQLCKRMISSRHYRTKTLLELSLMCSLRSHYLLTVLALPNQAPEVADQESNNSMDQHSRSDTRLIDFHLDVFWERLFDNSHLHDSKCNGGNSGDGNEYKNHSYNPNVDPTWKLEVKREAQKLNDFMIINEMNNKLYR